jgi:hypothetical protein
MITFATSPDSDTIAVEGVDYIRDPEDRCRYHKIAHREPSVPDMLADLIRADVSVTIKTDGAYGSGTIAVMTERPSYADGVPAEFDYAQAESVEDAVSAAWWHWVAPKEQTA